MYWFPINIGYRTEERNNTIEFWREPEWILIHPNDTVREMIFEIEARVGLRAGDVDMRCQSEFAYTIMKPKHFIWRHLQVMNRQLDTGDRLWFTAVYRYGAEQPRMDWRHAAAA